jgi:hypothetical protein
MPAGVAAALDALLVLVFAAVGRASHGGHLPLAGEEGNPVLGVLATAWPFVIGLAAGWTLVRALSHRWPLEVGPGVTVLVATVVVGMALRAGTGQGTAPSFVLVATVVLGALLVGWRALAARVAPGR